MKDLVKKEVAVLNAPFKEEVERTLHELADQLGLGTVINMLEKELAQASTITTTEKR